MGSYKDAAIDALAQAQRERPSPQHPHALHFRIAILLVTAIVSAILSLRDK